MKKLVRNVLLAATGFATLTGLTACGGVKAAKYTAGTPVKVGLICLHDNSSTYDKNFIDAMNEACATLGSTKVVDAKPIIKTGVPESNECYEAAKDLVKQGCNFIFADSFGHQDFMLKAAKEWPEVQFCHATGTNAKTANLANYHNGFASIYEGRFIAGLAAGYKLNEMLDAGAIKDSNRNADGDIKVGYVGAFTYAEVISGYTSWFLGVRQALQEEYPTEDVAMDVSFTGSWYDTALEQSAAANLINTGCAIVSQHADSMGAPGECESKNVPNISYNISTESECPKTFIAYSKINWAPYYTAIVESMYANGVGAIEGEVDHNWTGTMGTGSVKYDVTNTTTKLSAAHRGAVLAHAVALGLGTEKVFDVSRFTVTVVKTGDNQKNANATVDADGHLTSYKADTDGDYAPDTEVVATDLLGVKFFDESHYCSAPYFDCQIDNINLTNVKF